MKPRAWRDPLVASHALFLGNVLLWTTASLPCAGLLLLTTIASTCYHRSSETDRWWGWLPSASPVQAALVLLLLPLGLACKAQGDALRGRDDAEGYRRWHTAWHVTVSVGQAFLALLV
jgi:hypothetical protein